jgi:hypothetical protein
MTSRAGALVALVLLSVWACRGSRDPILDRLHQLEAAAEARSASRIEAMLAPDFRGSGLATRAEARAELTGTFALYETVNLEIHEVAVERGEDAARLRFRADFNGRPLQVGALAGFLPPSAMYRFDLGLRRDGRDWLVTTAEWEDVAPAGEAGASTR